MSYLKKILFDKKPKFFKSVKKLKKNSCKLLEKLKKKNFQKYYFLDLLFVGPLDNNQF